MCGSRGGGGRGSGPTLKNHKSIGCFSNTGPDPLKNHKSIGCFSNTGPDPLKIHNNGPSSAHQRNGFSLAGRWWPAFSCIWILSTFIERKTCQSLTPLTKLSGSAHVWTKLNPFKFPLWQNFLDPRMSRLSWTLLNWASTRENLSSGVCEQHRRRPACASAQTDQRLCYSPIEKYHI